jgi:hypothetical protein
MIESAVAMAVILEDATMWETAMALFAKCVLGYIYYLAFDGPIPYPAHGQPTDAILVWSDDICR